jgi:hypothetical protein
MINLTASEKDSALWKKIERELTTRRDSLRASNDTELDATKTARLRGQIALCKEVLGWAEPNPDLN